MNDDILDRHIHLIYNTVTDPLAWKDCLSEISTTINAKAGMIGVDDIQEKTHLTSMRYGFSEDAIDALAPYHAKCLWTHELIELNPKRFVTSEQLLAPKKYMTSELFNGFGRHFDSFHATGMYFDQTGDQALRMSFLRGQSQGAYGQRETDYLNRLLPHIKRAVSLSRKMLDQALLLQITEYAFDKHDHMVFIVDSFSKLINMNKAATASLKDAKWFDVHQNKLVFKKGLRNSEYLSALSSVTRPENLEDLQASVPFLVEFDEETKQGHYLMEVIRFQTHVESELSQIMNVKSETLAMVTIRNLSHSPQTLSDRLKQLFLLSNSETEIALLLAMGTAPKQIAEERCRSIETVRTQIKKITAKLDAKNTSHLIAKINQLSA